MYEVDVIDEGMGWLRFQLDTLPGLVIPYLRYPLRSTMAWHAKEIADNQTSSI